MRTVSKTNCNTRWHLTIEFVGLISRSANIVFKIIFIHDNFFLIVTLHYFEGYFLTYFLEILLKRSYTWLSAVVVNNVVSSALRDCELMGSLDQACFLSSLWIKILVQNVIFLFEGVPCDFNDFHSIQNCWVQRVEHICSA